MTFVYVDWQHIPGPVQWETGSESVTDRNRLINPSRLPEGVMHLRDPYLTPLDELRRVVVHIWLGQRGLVDPQCMFQLLGGHKIESDTVQTHWIHKDHALRYGPANRLYVVRILTRNAKDMQVQRELAYLFPDEPQAYAHYFPFSQLELQRLQVMSQHREDLLELVNGVQKYDLLGPICPACPMLDLIVAMFLVFSTCVGPLEQASFANFADPWLPPIFFKKETADVAGFTAIYNGIRSGLFVHEPTQTLFGGPWGFKWCVLVVVWMEVTFKLLANRGWVPTDVMTIPDLNEWRTIIARVPYAAPYASTTFVDVYTRSAECASTTHLVFRKSLTFRPPLVSIKKSLHVKYTSLVSSIFSSLLLGPVNSQKSSPADTVSSQPVARPSRLRAGPSSKTRAITVCGSQKQSTKASAAATRDSSSLKTPSSEESVGGDQTTASGDTEDGDGEESSDSDEAGQKLSYTTYRKQPRDSASSHESEDETSSTKQHVPQRPLSWQDPHAMSDLEMEPVDEDHNAESTEWMDVDSPRTPHGSDLEEGIAELHELYRIKEEGTEDERAHVASPIFMNPSTRVSASTARGAMGNLFATHHCDALLGAQFGILPIWDLSKVFTPFDDGMLQLCRETYSKVIPVIDSAAVLANNYKGLGSPGGMDGMY
ncbi:hypothetical protein FRC09_008774 [Ceratobasidium sp. 395]|nr:hypothetical protein FRC09_008774 [Ceratobasidium sp. 395]